MRKYKRLTYVFAALAMLLSNVMCAAVYPIWDWDCNLRGAGLDFCPKAPEIPINSRRTASKQHTRLQFMHRIRPSDERLKIGRRPFGEKRCCGSAPAASSKPGRLVTNAL